jgi:hypothetical protein
VIASRTGAARLLFPSAAIRRLEQHIDSEKAIRSICQNLRLKHVEERGLIDDLRAEITFLWGGGLLP